MHLHCPASGCRHGYAETCWECPYHGPCPRRAADWELRWPRQKEMGVGGALLIGRGDASFIGGEKMVGRTACEVVSKIE
jgi:hypothetical protein